MLQPEGRSWKINQAAFLLLGLLSGTLSIVQQWHNWESSEYRCQDVCVEKKVLKSEIFEDLGLPPLQLLVNGTHLFSL